MNIEIVPAPYSAMPLIERWNEQTFQEHRKAQPFAFPENYFRDELRKMIARSFLDSSGAPLEKSNNIHVAMLDDEIVGYIMLSVWLETHPDHPEIEIEDVYVVAKHRRKGIGRLLVEFAKSFADKQERNNLTAQVWNHNKASAKLFENSGFTQQHIVYRYGPDRQVKDLVYRQPEPVSANSGTKFGWLVLGLFAGYFLARYLGLDK